MVACVLLTQGTVVVGCSVPKLAELAGLAVLRMYGDCNLVAYLSTMLRN